MSVARPPDDAGPPRADAPPAGEPAAPVTHGRCLCGAVAFRVLGALGPVVLCHCSQCRRASGSAYSPNASIDDAQFRLDRGAEAVREHESSPGKVRAFCGQCGSPLWAARPGTGTRRVRLGVLVDPPSIEVSAHIHADARATWEPIEQHLPRWPAGPPPELVATASGAGAYHRDPPTS